MRVAVQQQIQAVSEDRRQVVLVAEVLVVGLGLPPGVVVQHPDARQVVHAGQLAREPAELVTPAPAIVLVVVVAFQDRRIHRGHGNAQVVEPVQAVRLLLGERDRPVQFGYEVLVVAPLFRIGRLRFGVLIPALSEVRLAQVPAHVMVTRDDHDAIAAQGQGGAQLVQEAQRVLVLRALAALGDVAGQDQQVDRRHALVSKPGEITDQVTGQRIIRVETVIPPELRVRDVQNRGTKLVTGPGHAIHPK